MLSLDDFLEKLNYSQSNNYRNDLTKFEPETAHLFRDAKNTGVKGIYMFRTSPTDQNKPPRPAVFIAQAQNDEEARRIHKNLWNLANAPIIAILTPNRVILYSGFNYSPNSERVGLLDTCTFEENDLRRLLALLSAQAIDSGRIWKGEYKDKLNSGKHVHARLLKNLKDLGDILEDQGLKPQIAHNLIGKYVYISYLYDREILSQKWLAQQDLRVEDIFGSKANARSLARLNKALEERFNGKIFPIDFDSPDAPLDFHVSLTANIFKGDQIISVDDRNKKIAIQLHMDFKAYNFQYIPVETLSAVYEQFLENDYDNGAIYTSEVLADYLLSEIETAKRLTRTTKILDPACGSGIFLVLAYRRLIEQTLRGRNAQKPTTKQLINLLSNIYGIERELDACYITEFSLILTLLHYIDLEPPELQNLAFHFPTLHNAQIFQADFFDFQGEDSEVNFWQLNLKFDWIIGNPPWLEADQNSTKQKFINAWLANPQNKTDRPVGSRQVAEAFSWVVTDLLSTNGVVGLLLPSTSLFNAESESYRKHFFKQFVILRITNFANLREILFKGRAEKPASVFIYRSKVGKEEKPDILHIAPLITNQLETTKNTEQWSIIIDENDIQTISSREASTGEFLLWKIALRGNYRDKRAIKQIDHLFQTTLAALAIKNNWEIYQGTALRPTEDNKPKDPIKHLPELEGQQQFDADLMKNSLTYFSLPLDILKPITKQNANVRLRSGEAGLLTSPAPHIIVASSGLRYAIYSDRDFIIPTPQIGISGNPEQSELLKALSVFLRSSLTYYYMFFHAPQWGVARRAKYLSSDQIKLLRVPDFTPSQIKELAQFWQNLVSIESERISQFLPKSQNLMLGSENTSEQFSAPQKLSTKVKEFRAKLQIELRARINEKINQLLEIPDELSIIVEEFVRVRLNADATAQIADTIRSPFPLELENYATRLRDYLDSFVTDGSHFQLKITAGPQLIECYLQMTRQQSPIPVQIETSSLESTSALDELSIALRQQINQWAYVQRGLRLFNEPDIYIYKAPRLVNWTQTQAMNDAADIIAQVLTTI